MDKQIENNVYLNFLKLSSTREIERLSVVHSIIVELDQDVLISLLNHAVLALIQ